MKQEKPEIRRIEDIVNNPSDRAKLQNFLDEAVRCKIRMKDEQDSISAMREDALIQLGCAPKMFAALVNIEFNQNFSEKQAELDALDTAIELLFMNGAADKG